MNGYRDPYKGAQDAAKVLVIFLLMFALVTILFQQQTRAASPEPFWAPEGLIVGVLYISDGENLDTQLGGVIWEPNTAVGTIMLLDAQGEYYPAGEVTITYWAEPDAE